MGRIRKRKRPEHTFAGVIRQSVEARVEARLATVPITVLRAIRCELEPAASRTAIRPPPLVERTMLPKKAARLLLDSYGRDEARASPDGVIV